MNTPKVPEVRFSKNGYEIRTEILAQAQAIITKDFEAKFAGWQLTSAKDTNSGQLITTVKMPEFPGLETILETAEKMYAFVNQTTKK